MLSMWARYIVPLLLLAAIGCARDGDMSTVRLVGTIELCSQKNCQTIASSGASYEVFANSKLVQSGTLSSGGTDAFEIAPGVYDFKVTMNDLEGMRATLNEVVVGVDGASDVNVTLGRAEWVPTP